MVLDVPEERVPEPIARRRQPAAVLLASLAVLLPGLALVVVGLLTGRAVRPIADDWCLAAPARDDGLLKMVSAFYSDSNGRVANAAANAIVYSQGLVGPKLLPGALLVAFAVGFALLGGWLLRASGRGAPVLALASVGTGVSVLLLFAPTVSYQILYWAPGSITHTLPALLALWTALAVLAAAGRRRALQGAALACAAVVGFVNGSLNEPFVIVSFLLAGTLLVGVRPWRAGANRYFAAACGAWMTGLTGGFLLLLTSPGLANRTRSIVQAPALSVDGFNDLMRQWGSTWGAIAERPVYLGALALGAFLGLVCAARAGADPRPERRRGEWLAAGAGVLVVVLGSLAVVAGLRTGYGPNGWGYDRAWTNFIVVALLVLVLVGFLLGEEAARRVGPRRPGALLAAAALSCLTLLSLLPSALDLSSDVRTRAEGWDRQNARIVREARAGQRDVVYTPAPIGGLVEPFFYDPQHDWQVPCISNWYRIDTLHPSSAWLRTPDAARYKYWVSYHRHFG